MNRSKSVTVGRVGLALFLASAVSVFALPQGQTVTSGDVSFNLGDNVLTVIQSSGRAIVNYDSFNIATPETVNFVQPGRDAAILNRVTGNNASEIAGALNANGHVYLINPNGILFSQSARINVHSLVASALDITDQDFLDDNLTFSGQGKNVVNQGTIKANSVRLLGANVKNQGDVHARDVIFGAGTRTVKLDDAAGGTIRLVVSVPSPDAGTVINQGVVDASGEQGGSVAMHGNRVGQVGTVSANGTIGDGGRIDIQADSVAALADGSLTTANGGSIGNGGEVIIFTPGAALFRPNAAIEARGGDSSGDGGFIEVSGRDHVEIFGRTDASAPHGDPGMFLIDPSDVYIQNVAPPGDGLWWNPGLFDPAVDDAVISITVLQNNLKVNDVMIRTASVGVPPAGSQPGDITVVDNIDLDGTHGRTLWLQASRNVIVNGNIVDQNPATADATRIELVGQTGAVTLNGSLNTGGGMLVITAPPFNHVVINNTVNTAGGVFSSAGVNFTLGAGAQIRTGGGAVNLLPHSGNVTINGTIDARGAAGAQSIGIGGTAFINGQMNAGTTVTFNGPATVAANVTAGTTMMFNNTLTVNGATRSGTDMTVADGFLFRATGTANLYADNALTLGGNVSGAASIDLRADYDGNKAGLLWIKGNASTDGATPAGTLTLVGDIQVDGTMTIGGPDLSLYGADRDSIDYNIASPLTAGGIIIRMGHDITDGTVAETPLLNANLVRLTARTGAIGGSGDADIETDAGAMSTVARGSVYLQEANNVTASGGITAGGLLDLIVAGTLTGDRATAGHTLRIAANGDINIDTLSCGGAMDLDRRALKFNTLTADSVDADMRGSIEVGRATLNGLADFKAAGSMVDNDSMITANDVILEASGNIGASAINLDVARISRVVAGGSIHIAQHRSGNTPLGLISAGKEFRVEVPNGGLADGNGSSLNFSAKATSYLELHGSCGEWCDGLQADIDNGNILTRAINTSGADHPDDWLWIALEGNIDGEPSLEYAGDVEIPGIMMFNNRIVGTESIGWHEVSTVESYTQETPHIRPTQGLWRPSSPYFLHNYICVNEPIALGFQDYLLHGVAEIEVDPEITRVAKRIIILWPEGYMW